MIYVIFNAVAIFAGVFLGVTVGKKIHKNQLDAVFLIVDICIIVVGLQGAIKTENPIMMIISLALGGYVGTALDVDGKFNKFGNFINSKIKFGSSENSEGIVALILLHSIGSMSIVGPINAALNKDGSILAVKSALDFTVSLIYGSNFGIGAAVSGVITLIYQSLMFCFASFIEPLMTPMVIHEIGAIGSVLIFALGLNLLRLTNLKIGDYLPALLAPVIYQIVLNIF